VFCYDLINEPISPAAPGTNWYSGKLFGGYDFLQYIARDPAGRTRGKIAAAWIDKLTAAIRQKDRTRLITVGLLPWVTGWQHLSGFVPKDIAPHVDFLSVHIYPKTKQPDEALRALRECAVGKPVVIEETFPLECSIEELENFLRSSRDLACGWIWHYDGTTVQDYDALERDKKLTLPQAIWRASLQSFIRLKPEFVPAATTLLGKEAPLKLNGAVAVPGSQPSGSLPVASTPGWPGPEWQRLTPAELGMDETKLLQARDYALTGGGSGYITRHGKLALAWGNPRQRYDLKSTTKSFGSVALGLAIKDGKLRLADKARRHHPTLGVPPESNVRTGWLDELTILYLASQTAGFEKPGGYTKLLFQPGTQWDYSDAGPNWLAECITLAYRRDLDEWMFARVFGQIGIRRDDLTCRQNAYRPATIEGLARREFGAGIHANVDAMARLGYLMLREGQWRGQEILTREYARLAPRTPAGHERLPVLHRETYGQAASHYGLLWWNNDDGTLSDVPRDAFWSWGLYDSLIVVMPSLDIVVARAGQSWKRPPSGDHYAVLKPFLQPIATAVTDAPKTRDRAPYPPSPVIKQINWAPKESILRLAKGSDNWPLTWADDNTLYGAYGDGNGFEPFLPEKLSLGLAKINGAPPDLAGENIRTPSLEQKGDGPRGRKASGLLMVDGVLYLWMRNANNSQLRCSADHGATWTKADWQFTTSFGCPTFLNFGRNYAGARDEFVYLYSHDADSAYTPADRFVLARAPNDRLREQDAYEFFVRLTERGQPLWTKTVAERGAVFSHPGCCYRSGITYNAALRRYLWVQILPQSRHPQGPRFQGGFGVYDAPEPWGPWTTAYFTEDWDVGPGETASFPTKLMSANGRMMHLVFSGNDCFSVRRADLLTASDASAPRTE
jgi:CubicO group peptidase (beta-lactamase class C family)